MRFQIEKRELLPVLTRAGRLAPKESDRTILTNLALRLLRQNVLEVRATNSSIYYEARLITSPGENGQLTVRADDFIKYVTLADGEDIVAEDKEGWLHVAYGEGSRPATRGVRYSTQEWATFPNPFATTVGNKFFIRAGEFRTMLDNMKFAIAREETGLTAANCLTMRCQPDKVYLAAHNQKCIATGQLEYTREGENAENQALFMIPGSVVNQLIGLLPRENDLELSIAQSSSGGHLVISWNGNERLIVASHEISPMSLAMLSKNGPDTCDYQVLIDRKQIETSIARLASPENVCLQFKKATTGYELSLYSATDGFEGQDEVEGLVLKSVDQPNSDGVMIGLNARALAQMLDSTDSQKIVLSFSSNQSRPIVAQGFENDQVKQNYMVFMLPVVFKKPQVNYLAA